MAYTDNFNRSSLGANWTAATFTTFVSPTIQTSAYACSTGGASNSLGYYSAGSFGETPYSTVTLYRLGTVNDDSGAAIWKSTGAYILDGYSGKIHVSKVTSGGSWSENGSGYTATLVTGDTLSIEITSSTVVTFKYNGSEIPNIGSWTDNTYRSSLYSGFYSYTSGTTVTLVDSWEGGDLASSSVTGSLTKTLDDLTPSLVGIVEVVGLCTKTLENISKTIDGKLDVVGITSKTLEDIARSISGTSGALGATGILDDLSLESDGTISEPTSSGILTQTLDDLTKSLTGTVDLAGGVSKTLDDLGKTLTGTVDVVGLFSKTLDDSALSAAGAIPAFGSFDKTLEGLTSSLSGQVDVIGLLSQSLDSLSLQSIGGASSPLTTAAERRQASGIPGITPTHAPDGAIDTAVDRAEAAGMYPEGLQDEANEVTGTLAKTLDELAPSLSGKVELSASCVKTLDDITRSLSGQVEVKGTFSKTLEDVTRSAAGRVDVAGIVSKTLDDLTKTLTGKVDLVGTFAKTLEDLTISAAATLSTNSEGILAKTLDDLTRSIAGKVDVVATLSKTLGDLTKTIVGTVPALGSAIKTLDDLSKTLAGKVDVAGGLAKNLDDLAKTLTGKVDLVGTLSKTLDDVSISSTGVLGSSSIGDLIQTLEGVGCSSQGGNLVMGSLDKLLADLTSAGAIVTAISGQLNRELEPIVPLIRVSSFIQDPLAPTLIYSVVRFAEDLESYKRSRLEEYSPVDTITLSSPKR